MPTDKIELTLYSCGDSNNVATWSNVPYLFGKTLVEKGISVNRVNIGPNRLLNRWFNTTSYYLFRKFLRLNACPTFARTPIHRLIINRRLKKAAKKYPDSQLNLFLSYGFINQYSDRPNVQWCDWSDKIVIQRLGREPKWYEKGSLASEAKAIRGADAVYTMFPNCKGQMQSLYDRDINWLGINVVNSLYDKDYDAASGQSDHYRSNRILFIGNHLYHHGAVALIKAINTLRDRYPELRLDIIGMKADMFDDKLLNDNITCHGYLHKNIDSERAKYYDLILHSKIFINPSQQWGGYSSTIEAMYYGCPVIVAPYEDFVKEMGSAIDFGYYYKENRDNLSTLISKILEMPESQYLKLSSNAHQRVQEYTWSNYVDLFLNDLREKGLLQ